MNAYQTLGVSPSASQADIDRAYADLYQRYSLFHTSSNLTRFMEINAAYALLSYPETRNAIDQNAGVVPMESRLAGHASHGAQRLFSTASIDPPRPAPQRVRPPAEESYASEPNQHLYHHHYHHSSPGGAELLAHAVISLGILGVFLLPFLL